MEDPRHIQSILHIDVHTSKSINCAHSPKDKRRAHAFRSEQDGPWRQENASPYHAVEHQTGDIDIAEPERFRWSIEDDLPVRRRIVQPLPVRVDAAGVVVWLERLLGTRSCGVDLHAGQDICQEPNRQEVVPELSKCRKVDRQDCWPQCLYLHPDDEDDKVGYLTARVATCKTVMGGQQA